MILLRNLLHALSPDMRPPPDPDSRILFPATSPICPGSSVELEGNDQIRNLPIRQRVSPASPREPEANLN